MGSGDAACDLPWHDLTPEAMHFRSGPSSRSVRPPASGLPL